jgi:hypothetical protein
VGPVEPLLGDRFSNWVLAMLVTTPLALVFGTVLALADGALGRWLETPSGPRAWWTSAAASLIVALVYAVHPPGQHDLGPPFAAAILVPMLVAAPVTRWVGGKRRST